LGERSLALRPVAITSVARPLEGGLLAGQEAAAAASAWRCRGRLAPRPRPTAGIPAYGRRSSRPASRYPESVGQLECARVVGLARPPGQRAPRWSRRHGSISDVGTLGAVSRSAYESPWTSDALAAAGSLPNNAADYQQDPEHEPRERIEVLVTSACSPSVPAGRTGPLTLQIRNEEQERTCARQ
jgi:hypothetical protein